jgi:conjugative transfer signal peptidase TraF
MMRLVKSKAELWTIVAILLVAVAAPMSARYSGLRFNDTNSLPIGWYRITPGPSPYVAICLPDAIVHSAIQAGLSLPSGGECPDGHRPILKKIYRATSDKPITFDAQGFRINGRLLANTAPKEKSKTGVRLQHQAFGTYRDGIWAVSGYNPDSFDSRYFGPVSEASIRYYAVPFVLF